MTSMSVPSHIEFLGAAGSGKSTLLPAAVQAIPGAYDYNAAYIKAIQSEFPSLLFHSIDCLPEKHKNKLIRYYSQLCNLPLYAYHDFVTEYPEYIDCIERALTEQVEPKHRDYVRQLLIKRAARYHISTNGETSIVFDEGFAMSAVSLCASKKGSINHLLFQEFMSIVPCPDLLIVVKADLETCKQRIQSRAEGVPSRVEDQTPEEWYSQLVLGARCVSIVGEIADERGATVLYIDNNGPLSESKHTLKRKIKEIYNN